MRSPLRAVPGAFVYFVQAGDEHGPIKIGHTNNVAKRLEALRNGNALPLRLLGTAPAIDRETAKANEATFHELFADLRIRGEWFRWSQAIIDFIAIQRQMAATFFGTNVVIDCNLVRTDDDRMLITPKVR